MNYRDNAMPARPDPLERITRVAHWKADDLTLKWEERSGVVELGILQHGMHTTSLALDRAEDLVAVLTRAIEEARNGRRR